MTVPEIAVAAGGRIVESDPSPTTKASSDHRTGFAVTSVSTDSRSIEPGALFVALAAERDGHAFVGEAFAAGAVAALVDHEPATGAAGAAGPLVVVADTLVALGRLGIRARDRIGTRPVIGVTGSSGKTSTKDLLASALARSHSVCASVSSFNNEIGVPLTLLSAAALPDEGPLTDIVVCEMGARGPGQIDALCSIARPTVGIVTNVGTAHVECYVDGRAGIARAKGELVEALPPHGTAVLNADDETTPELAARTRARVLRFGRGADADVRVEALVLDSELRPWFRLVTPWGTSDVRLEARGAHQSLNAAAAAAAALAVGADLASVVEGLVSARVSRWRMEVTRRPDGLVVINDAYNANPDSTAAAIDALAAMGLGAGGRRWAVLGTLAELGDEADAAYHDLGARAARLGVDALMTVGDPARGYVPGFESERARRGDDTGTGAGTTWAGNTGRTGRETVVIEASDPGEAARILAGRLSPADVVLIKASRVAGLDVVAKQLLREPGSSAGGAAA